VADLKKFYQGRDFEAAFNEVYLKNIYFPKWFSQLSPGTVVESIIFAVSLNFHLLRQTDFKRL
jgi:hypothetical protein